MKEPVRFERLPPVPLPAEYNLVQGGETIGVVFTLEAARLLTAGVRLVHILAKAEGKAPEVLVGEVLDDQSAQQKEG